MSARTPQKAAGSPPRLRGKKVLPDKLEARLAQHSAGIGVAINELRLLCLSGGLEMLEQGALTVRQRAAERLPLYLPAADVRLLQEICAAAAIEGGAESFADVVLGDIIRDSLSSTPRLLAGVPELIFDNWSYEPAEERTCREAVLAVVSRWNGTGGH